MCLGLSINLAEMTKLINLAEMTKLTYLNRNNSFDLVFIIEKVKQKPNRNDLVQSQF